MWQKKKNVFCVGARTIDLLDAQDTCQKNVVALPSLDYIENTVRCLGTIFPQELWWKTNEK